MVKRRTRAAHAHALRAKGALPIALCLSLAASAGCGSDPAPVGADASVDAGADLDGAIYTPRPVVCDERTSLPNDLECTGLFSDMATQTLAPGVKAFVPGISLWSDGAQKRRWLYLPPGQKIDTQNMDEWVFPVGTKVWKDFSFGSRPLETRLFRKESSGQWVFTTYVWQADKKRATRLDTGVANAMGTYEIPSQMQCAQCHRGYADRLLGVSAIELGVATAEGVTLASLVAEGLLTAPPSATTITIPGDAKTQAALGWLHVNCGVTCHSPAGSATGSFTGLQLRLSARALLAGMTTPQTTGAYTTTIDQPIATGLYLDDVRYIGFKRVVARDPERSLLAAVIGMRGPGQMPPIASHTVDENGVRFVREWIQGLP